MQSAPQHDEVFAGVAYPEPIWFALMAPNRDPGRGEQLMSHLLAYAMTAIVAQASQFFDRHGAQRRRRRVMGKNRGRQLTVETSYIAGELWKTEVQCAMKLAHSVAEVLQEPFTQSHYFT